MAKSARPKNGTKQSTARTSCATVSGPGVPASPGSGDVLAEKMAGTQNVALAFPFNPTKSAEYDQDAALRPREGLSVKVVDPIVGASTVTELNGSDKAGSGGPHIGHNPTVGSLDRVRVDSTDRSLTTNQGVPVGDNQNSLKAGLRGPTLLEDFILREKITHFDHERIPERIVHGGGSAAHGFFECTKALQEYSRASLFADVGKQTPVFVRFSTVLGERGSTDTARDVRGFAVKFYTDEGNWDLVGNNIPVFFIQDAMKFPDLVHAAKPEPHFAMPQAASAHDTFWDFASLMPEITHMLMWAMSDRAIPRSYRTMQGFGVHTYRLVNADGESHFVKFHWSPRAGTHSLVWDEAVKISGADSDFHRRDLWEAIEAGAHPEYELGLQINTGTANRSWCSATARSCSRPAASRPRCPLASQIPASSLPRPMRKPRPTTSSWRSPSIGTLFGRLTRRACEPPTGARRRAGGEAVDTEPRKRSTTMASRNTSTDNPITDKAASFGQELADRASDAKDAMSDMARTATRKVDESRSMAADRLEGAASTVYERAADLPGGERVKELASAAADRLSTTADYVRNHDAKRMMADVETAVKNNPGPALLIAAAFGFLLGRALTRD
jgi:ElaB/YqjD/DUF883 family membrane-anchored ribosome-binding protein